jgi:hypothetical protein
MSEVPDWRCIGASYCVALPDCSYFINRAATMLASRIARPCARQTGRFIVPLRARYSSAVEASYEHIKVSTPRTGVALSISTFTKQIPTI